MGRNRGQEREIHPRVRVKRRRIVARKNKDSAVPKSGETVHTALGDQALCRIILRGKAVRKISSNLPEKNFSKETVLSIIEEHIKIESHPLMAEVYREFFNNFEALKDEHASQRIREEINSRINTQKWILFGDLNRIFHTWVSKNSFLKSPMLTIEHAEMLALEFSKFDQDVPFENFALCFFEREFCRLR